MNTNIMKNKYIDCLANIDYIKEIAYRLINIPCKE